MKKMYIVTYHTGEFESSFEINIAVTKTREEAELLIDEIISHWNSSEYDPNLDFVLNPNNIWSLKFQYGNDFNPDAFNICVIRLYEV